MVPTLTFINAMCFVNFQFLPARGFHLHLCLCLLSSPWALCAELCLWPQEAVQKKVNLCALGLVILRTPACEAGPAWLLEPGFGLFVYISDMVCSERLLSFRDLESRGALDRVSV